MNPFNPLVGAIKVLYALFVDWLYTGENWRIMLALGMAVFLMAFFYLVVGELIARSKTNRKDE